jgi:hypothetical protein
MSTKSLYKLGYNDLFNNQILLKQRYNKLNYIFTTDSLRINNTEYSFFVLKTKNRDLLKKKLISKGIYLPVHWPKSSQNNLLYDELISIPLFSNYTDIEFNYMLNNIIKCIKDINCGEQLCD